MRAGVKCFGIIILLSTWAWAENWPHWRGPDRDGVSPETNLPVEWSATENVTWKVPMTAWSGATPIIWGDYIFLNAAEGGKRTPPRHGRRRRGGRGQPSGSPPPPLSEEQQPQTSTP